MKSPYPQIARGGFSRFRGTRRGKRTRKGRPAARTALRGRQIAGWRDGSYFTRITSWTRFFCSGVRLPTTLTTFRRVASASWNAM